jgi:hypothetical protein
VRNAQEIARNVWLCEMAAGSSGRQKNWWYATLRWTGNEWQGFTGWDRMRYARPYNPTSEYGTVSGRFHFEGQPLRFHNQVSVDKMLGLLVAMSKEYST